MKWSVSLIGVLAGVALAAAWRVSSAREASLRTGDADLLVAQAVIDLGDVPRSRTINLQIPIANASTSRSVHVTDITTSCGCMLVTERDIVLAPAEEQTITVAATSAAGAGSTTNVVTLVVADASAKSIRVEMRSIDPFPPAATVSDSVVHIRLREIYEGAGLRFLGAYAGMSDAPLDAYFDEQTGELAIPGVQPGDRVEVVFTMPDKAEERLSQIVEFNEPIDEPH